MDAFVIRKKAQIFQNDYFILTFSCKESKKEKELKHQIETNGGICIERSEDNSKKQIFALVDTNFNEEMLTKIPKNAIFLQTKWIYECIQAKSRLAFSTYQVSFGSSKRFTSSSSIASISLPPRPLKKQKLKTDKEKEEEEEEEEEQNVTMLIPTITPRSTWKWQSIQQESLWILDTFATDETEKEKKKKKPLKIAAFDLDGTLIVTKSGKRFSQHATDWKFFDSFHKMKTKLDTLFLQHDRLVIFSNQNGVTKGHATIEQVHQKVEDIVEQLQVPCSIYLSLKDDLMRKPRTGAWKVFTERTKQEIDLTKSFYCGDAAGRPKSGTIRPKDFASSDFKFALNLGIQFFTPEQFFLDSKQRLHCHPEVREIGFDPRSLCTHNKDQKDPKDILLLKQLVNSTSQQQQNLIVLVGPPASGKSTLSTSLLKEYTWINQDTLGSLATCKQKSLQALKQGKHVVVDSTNRNVKTRREWIDLSTQIPNLQVFCVHLDIPKPLCMHLNVYRGLTGGQKVPDVAIHTFYKSMEIPQVQEGFKHVIKLSFLPKEEMKEEEKKLLCSFLY